MRLAVVSAGGSLGLVVVGDGGRPVTGEALALASGVTCANGRERSMRAWMAWR